MRGREACHGAHSGRMLTCIVEWRRAGSRQEEALSRLIVETVSECPESVLEEEGVGEIDLKRPSDPELCAFWLLLAIKLSTANKSGEPTTNSNKKSTDSLRFPRHVSLSCWRRLPTCLGDRRFPVRWKM